MDTSPYFEHTILTSRLTPLSNKHLNKTSKRANEGVCLTDKIRHGNIHHLYVNPLGHLPWPLEGSGGPSLCLLGCRYIFRWKARALFTTTRINDNIIAIDRPHVSIGWIKRGEKTVARWREGRGGFRASCRGMTDRSSVQLPQVPPVLILYWPDLAGAAASLRPRTQRCQQSVWVTSFIRPHR